MLTIVDRQMPPDASDQLLTFNQQLNEIKNVSFLFKLNLFSLIFLYKAL